MPRSLRTIRVQWYPGVFGSDSGYVNNSLSVGEPDLSECQSRAARRNVYFVTGAICVAAGSIPDHTDDWNRPSVRPRPPYRMGPVWCPGTA